MWYYKGNTSHYLKKEKKRILTIIRDKKAKTREWDILEKKLDRGTQNTAFSKFNFQRLKITMRRANIGHSEIA